MPEGLKRHMELEEIATRYGVLPDAGRISTGVVRHYRLMVQVEDAAAAMGFDAGEDE